MKKLIKFFILLLALLTFTCYGCAAEKPNTNLANQVTTTRQAATSKRETPKKATRKGDMVTDTCTEPAVSNLSLREFTIKYGVTEESNSGEYSFPAPDTHFIDGSVITKYQKITYEGKTAFCLYRIGDRTFVNAILRCPSGTDVIELEGTNDVRMLPSKCGYFEIEGENLAVYLWDVTGQEEKILTTGIRNDTDKEVLPCAYHVTLRPSDHI